MDTVRAACMVMLGLVAAASADAQQFMAPGFGDGARPLPAQRQGTPVHPGSFGHPAAPAVFQTPAGPAQPMIAPVSFQGAPVPGPVSGPVPPAACHGGCMGGCAGGGCMGGGLGGGFPGGLGVGCAGGGCGSGAGPCSTHHFHAFAEVSLLVPNLDGTFVSGSFTSAVPAVDDVFDSTRSEVDNEVLLAGRTGLHWQAEHLGIAGTIWYMGISDVAVTPLDLDTFDVLGEYTEERLQAWTGDVEGTFTWHLNFSHVKPVSWSFQGSLGMRWVDFETDTVALGGANLDDLRASNGALGHIEFEGSGITGGIRGRRRLWPSHLLHHNAELSFYWGLRASLVGGDLEGYSQTTASVSDLAGAGTTDVAADDALDETNLFIGETQVGMMFEQSLCWYPARWFVRAGFEYQYWDFDSELAIMTQSAVLFDQPPLNVESTAFSAVEAPELSLVGASIAGGLVW